MGPGRHLQGSASEAASPGPGLGGIHVPEGRRQAAGGARTPRSGRGALRPRSPTWTNGHLGEGLNTLLFLGAAGGRAVHHRGSWPGLWRPLGVWSSIPCRVATCGWRVTWELSVTELSGGKGGNSEEEEDWRISLWIITIDLTSCRVSTSGSVWTKGFFAAFRLL